MRTLTATLTAAQKSLSSRPALLVQVKNQLGSAKRLYWNSWYAGSEADSYHAATSPGDSSLVRARTGGTPATVLYTSRVTSPGAGSDYSVWTQVPGMLITGKGIALASRSNKVALAYVADNVGVNTLYVRESTDYGASWGSAVQVATGATADLEHLALAYFSADVLVLFYTTGASSQNLYRIRRNAGTWGSAALWSNSANAITGLAAVYSSDIELLIAGKDSSSNYLLWGCVYGLGVNQADDTWSALKEIKKTHSGTSVAYSYPSIAQPDVLRESYVEVYTGTESYTRGMGLYSRSALDFIDNLHHDDFRLPLVSGGAYGFAISYNATHVFLSTSKGLYAASLAATATNVSADLIALKQVIRPFSGSLELVLNNAGSAYNTALTLGQEVDFLPGYYSTAGAEYSSGQTYYIESIEIVTGGGKGLVRVIAVDAWGLLARNQARAARELNQGASSLTYKQVIEYFLSLSGISLTVVSSSSPFTGEYPRVSIYQGGSYLTYVRKLYKRLNDLVYLRGASARSFNPSSSDASVYSYGGAAGSHPLLSGRYSSNLIEANRLQVQGLGVYSDAFVQAEIDKALGRFSSYFDVNADSAAKASAIATALSNKEQYRSMGGEVVVPVNCGQELYDVIDITDSAAGLSAARRRIFGIDLLYDSTKGRYAMELMLGAV